MSKIGTRTKDAPKTEDPADEELAAPAPEPDVEDELDAEAEPKESDEPQPKTTKESAAEKNAEAEPEADEPTPEAGKKLAARKSTKAEADEPTPEAGKKLAAKQSSKAEPEADDSKAGLGRRSWRGVPVKTWLVRATVAVAVVGSAVTAGLQWYDADQAAQRDQERQEVRSSAAEFGQALLSYDHTKLQDARNHVLALASDDFAKTYDEAFTGGLEGVITKLKADATATVRTVYLGEIEDGTAKAVVVMDSEVHSTAGTRRVLGSYLDMKLARRGGTWKVTDVTSVGAANESMTDPDGKQQKPGAGVPAPEKTP